MKINLYLLKFCGLFDFDTKQKSQLCSSNFFERRQILPDTDSKTWEYVRNQYYPFFRPYITNENFLVDDFAILTNTHHSPKEIFFCRVGECNFFFSILRVELFLFPEAPGIISLDIQIQDENLSLEKISKFVNAIRNYNSRIWEQNDKGDGITILELIEDRILGKAMNKYHRKSNKNIGQNIADFRGSKLKVFQVVDISDTEVELKKVLFELGTGSPIGSGDACNDFSAHSNAYYEDIIKNSINVYNNWKALCLFDTFTVVGRDYLKRDYVLKTWDENYFRIYMYNLYFKYRLFAVNGEGLQEKKRLKKQRADFYEFISVYDNDHISYNYLPNLLHYNFKMGLHTRTETDALRSKIEHINGIINEGTSKMTNWILFGLAIIGLIPSNWSEFTGEGIDNSSSFSPPYWPNLAILIFKIAIVASIFIGHLIFSGRLRTMFKGSGKRL